MPIYPTVSQGFIGGGSVNDSYTDAQRIALGLSPGARIVKPDSGYPDKVWILCYNSGTAQTANYAYQIGYFDTGDSLAFSAAAIAVVNSATPAANARRLIGKSEIATPANSWAWYQIQGRCTISNLTSGDFNTIGYGVSLDASTDTLESMGAAFTQKDSEVGWVYAASGAATTEASICLVGHDAGCQG